MPDAWIEIATDDECFDAFVVAPEGPGRFPPVVVLAESGAAALARRLAGQGYFALAPDWTGRPAEERREDAEAWLDWLADDRRVDDLRVGILGLGDGADLAMELSAWRAERIAAVAAFGGRGFPAALALEIAQRINGAVRLGYPLGVSPARLGTLETALCLAGVDFDVEIYGAAPDWPSLIDFRARRLRPPEALAPGAQPWDGVATST